MIDQIMYTMHTPVLLSEVIKILAPKKGETVVDATIGLGGHSKAFFERIGRKGKLIGIDADATNLAKAAKALRGANVQLIQGNFRECLPDSCDILFADLGVSSPHFDDPARGFSFREVGPLDSRYDQKSGQSASEFIRQTSEKNLAAVFHEFGELPKSALLACAIKRTCPKTTVELVDIVSEVFGWRGKHMLPQVFQALRIAVNDELGALRILLDRGPMLLKSGGRMGIISYHSLEDRLVKRRFMALTSAVEQGQATYVLLTKKAVKPTMEEIEMNPRARSAVFRAILKH